MTYSIIPSRAPMSGLGLPPDWTGYAPYCGRSPRVLQQMLYDLGYYAGPIDGDFGTNSQRAMATFKREEGLGTGAVRDSDCERIAKRWNDKMITSGQVDPLELPTTDRPMPKEFYTRAGALQRVSSGQQTMDQKYDESPFDQSAADGGALARTKSWWEEQSTVTKVAIVGGGIAAVGGVLYVATR
jgi:peptidoglycan hydrolase-like protein with peptidoglycan-binding domain